MSVGSAVSVDLKTGHRGYEGKTSTSLPKFRAINVINAEVATTITQTQIRELPTLTRERLRPGRGRGQRLRWQGRRRRGMDSATTRGTGYNINGQRASGTNILLNGSANNNELNTTVGQNISDQLRPGIQRRDEQFLGPSGRATGGIVNVLTKSGTNNFSGNGLRVLSQRWTLDQHLRQQGQRDREGRVHPPSDGLQHRRANPARQDALLLEPRIHPGAQRGHGHQLGTDPASSSARAHWQRGTSSTHTAAT